MCTRDITARDYCVAREERRGRSAVHRCVGTAPRVWLVELEKESRRFVRVRAESSLGAADFAALQAAPQLVCRARGAADPLRWINERIVPRTFVTLMKSTCDCETSSGTTCIRRIPTTNRTWLKAVTPRFKIVGVRSSESIVKSWTHSHAKNVIKPADW